METLIQSTPPSGFTGMFLTASKTGWNLEARSEPALISIVEDDAPVLKSLARLIRTAGYRVRTFGSAEEFLESGRDEEVACIILDLQLPGMSGLDLQARLVAQGYPAPVVFVTAHTELETRTQALQGGAVAFLGKPFSEDALLDAIRSGIERR